LDQLEAELKLPVVASNPAMLWLILSKLGLRYAISGYGKLLSSWPSPPGPSDTAKNYACELSGSPTVTTTNEIAAHEYGAGVENPLTLWDLHWLKELDDEGYIDDLITRLSAPTQRR
jgi:hypothetical protein